VTADPVSKACGWNSDLPTFYGTEPRVVRLRLESFVREPGPGQLQAWDDAIPWLQRECTELVRCEEGAKTYAAILEYELPREGRRPDVIILEDGAVVVVELKGKAAPSQADRDQVAAYARDLRCYHAECHDRAVLPVLVPQAADAVVRTVDGVHIVGPAGIHPLLLHFAHSHRGRPVSAEAFLRPDAYAPLPSLIRAARDLFHHESLPSIRRARAATDPAVERITRIAHDAARTRTRRLVLVTGVPGAGKTLVGLRVVHAGFLDDLAVERRGKRPAAPAVFLSGNGPLVRVLQDALKGAGGGGKAFVRGVKDYVKTYSAHPDAVPPEHLLVFDEAQRAWDAQQVASKHKGGGDGRSEPEHFVEFAGRIPEWCVVVGLIGSGQEIHVGEEGGIVQWRRALDAVSDPGSWTVHAPAALEPAFQGGRVRTEWEPTLSLDTELRFHAASQLHDFVALLLERGDAAAAAPLASQLNTDVHRLCVTRDLAAAKRYARDRYADAPEARFGLVASARDILLPAYGVDGIPKWPRSLDVAKWFNAPQTDARSCRGLELVATEFDVQGLELELAILCWGSDYARRDGRWVVEKYRRSRRTPLDLHRLRQNVYRVLLTRGRDGTVVFVPADPWLDETYAFLREAGLRVLDGA
jgi:hypothetical protein